MAVAAAPPAAGFLSCPASRTARADPLRQDRGPAVIRIPVPQATLEVRSWAWAALLSAFRQGTILERRAGKPRQVSGNAHRTSHNLILHQWRPVYERHP